MDDTAHGDGPSNYGLQWMRMEVCVIMPVLWVGLYAVVYTLKVGEFHALIVRT